MCFVSYDIIEKTATRPIICYKAVRNRFFGLLLSPVFRTNFIYIRGIRSRRVKLKPTPDIYFEKNVIVIDKGYHSYKDVESALRITGYGRDIAVKCIIPKGAKYYEGNHDFVSSQLIIKRKAFKV